MTTSRGIALALFVVALAQLPFADARAQGTFALRGSVIGNGGGSASGAGIGVRGTVGQPAVGASLGGAGAACGGFWCGGGLAVVGVGPWPGGDGGNAALVFDFSAPMPNPTRGATIFRLALPRAGRVLLEAFDVAGRRLDSAVDKDLAAGRYELHWDARGAAPGVYFARLVVDGQVRARRRLVVLR